MQQKFRRALVVLVFAGVTGDETCRAGECDGIVSATTIGEEKSQKDYYEKASHYDTIWGMDNLHLGFYPHLGVSSTTTVRLTHQQAATALTERMVALAGIKHTSKILDLGAGKGRACYEMAVLTGASCVGMDLASKNVARGNEIAAANPGLALKFVEGSFTDLPQAIFDEGPYDVIFAQVSFCHVHKLLDKIFAQVVRVASPTSVVVVNDYLGSDWEPDPETKEHVYKRLHFEVLSGPRKWRETAAEAGLVLLHYETLDDHMRTAYVDMAHQARQLGFNSTDGTPLYVNYEETVQAITRRDIGMNLALFSL